MEKFDGFEYTKKDLIGHGAFAIVYKGRYADVSYPFTLCSVLIFFESKALVWAWI